MRIIANFVMILFKDSINVTHTCVRGIIWNRWKVTFRFLLFDRYKPKQIQNKRQIWNFPITLTNTKLWHAKVDSIALFYYFILIMFNSSYLNSLYQFRKTQIFTTIFRYWITLWSLNDTIFWLVLMFSE